MTKHLIAKIITGCVVGGILSGIVAFVIEHHHLAQYANHQKQQLQDSIASLNDSLDIYREWFNQAVE